MAETAKQRRRAGKKQRHAAASEERWAVWPAWDIGPLIPPVTVCDGCGFTAAISPDPNEVWVTACLLCGAETATYA